MNCPLCSTTTKDDAAECPSCGAIFAKLRERKRREKEEAAAALAQIQAPPPSRRFNLWTLRIAAGVIVVAWLIGFGLYYRSRLLNAPNERKPRASRPALAKVRMRDPVTGKFKEVEVLQSPRSAPPDGSERRFEPAPENRDDRPAEAPRYDPDFDD
ncbi:MAG: hypothetical protein COV48_02965 [Elusimicrobia bacterium CG11_big_fil_rev_8_21_14_0_20_64_6]|nr:MAG: hypothetical protein COV48_02965 [Elusimicrobia bacterium CG11_big_fil_rev_8_21_14_0_20_64_6]